MGCRKNQATLSPAEKAAFVAAVLQLKTAVPSVLHPGDPALHRYDDYVETHMNAMMRMDGSDRVPGWAHKEPAFFPWHREMLRRFEIDLQAVDPTVTLPYWDWTTDQSNVAAPWTDDFMGALPAGTDEVTTGPFRSAVWVKRVFEAGDADPKLRRGLGRTAFGALATALPSHDQVYGPAGALTETPYDSKTWDQGVTPSFRDRAEGWHGLGSIHNRVHLWVAGSMLPSTSPNDPIFFLHHCNVDRLLSQWQRQHPGETYHPNGAGVEVAPPGQNLNDAMIFNDLGQPAPWSPTSVTPAQLWRHHLPPADYWYDTDLPEVELITPSVSFTDIPEGIGGVGITTYRPVRLAVLSCQGATFQITAGPTLPFTAPLGTSFPVGEAHGAPAAEARVWIGYTSTTAGANAVGSVSVHCIETGEDFVVPITANTVARRKAAMALVLDHSGSMIEDSGDGHPKVEKLKQAVAAFTTLMLPGDGLAIIRFDDTAQTLMGVTDVGPVTPVVPGSGRDLANGILAGTQLDPAGSTSIGAGITAGRQALDTAPATMPPWAVKAMLVVTDGVENTPPTIAAASASLSANSFAIGIGTPANISVPALDALTQGHGGFLVVTGAITTDQSFRLTKYFLQALAGITNAQVVVDPQGELIWGATYRIPFRLAQPDIGCDAILLCPAAGAVEMALQTPGGEIITQATPASEPGVQFVRRGGLAFYRVSLPALLADPSGSRGGPWHVLLRLGKDRAAALDEQAVGTRRSVPFSVIVHAYSNLVFHAALTQVSREPGSRVTLHATLAEYDVPVERRARVWAEIVRPDGAMVTIGLAEGEAGLFAGGFIAAQAGLYVVRVRASGATFSGEPFDRERTLTATAVPGADRPGQTDPGLLGWLQGHDERLCRLLTCLLEDAALGRLLAQHGADPKHMRECVAQFCKGIYHTAGELPRNSQDPSYTADDLHRALAAIARASLSGPSMLGTDSVAIMPEPRPVVPAFSPPSAAETEGKIPRGMGGTMFGLSPEDLARGEPPEVEAENSPRERSKRRDQEREARHVRARGTRGPSTQHGLSPEDQQEQEKRQKD
jgi:hypothetical protein